jgi:hypothetical protein
MIPLNKDKKVVQFYTTTIFANDKAKCEISKVIHRLRTRLDPNFGVALQASLN